MQGEGRRSPGKMRQGPGIVLWVRRHLWITTLALIGALAVLFVLLPVMTTLCSTSLQALSEALAAQDVLSSLLFTFYAGGLATLAALLSGVPLAYLLARRSFPGKRIVQGVINLPVVIPHTAAGVALLLVFGRRGVLGQPLAALGLTFTDRVPGVVVGMLFVGLPFLVNAATEAFVLIDPELELVAETLGANKWQAVRYVTLPLAQRGILAGALMMWARGISEFGAVVILAYHPKIIPTLVYERFAGLGLAAAQPVTALLIILSLVIFVLLQTLLSSGKSPSPTQDD